MSKNQLGPNKVSIFNVKVANFIVGASTLVVYQHIQQQLGLKLSVDKGSAVALF